MATTMENEESLMHVLTRLSLSIEEAMRQKRAVEERLTEASNKVTMLTQANDALMKHVASLETRNEIVVNGLLKIVDSVDRSCRQLTLGAASTDSYPDAGPVDEDKDEFGIEEESEADLESSFSDTAGEVTTPQIEALSPQPEVLTSSSKTKVEDNNPETRVDEVVPEEEPQSAELRSLPIDPLVNSRIDDYATEPGVLQQPRRSSNMRSGRLRNSRLGSALRKSGGLFRRLRTSDSFPVGKENERRLFGGRSGSVKPDLDGIPIPDATCGCFLQSIFGCRH